MKRFRWLVYAQQFTHHCMPIYAFYAIMFMERSGLSTPQISLLLVFWSLVGVVAELPAGTLADRFSRRSVLIWSNVCQVATFAIWLVFPSFWGYGFGFLLWGIGTALSSGAFEAYVYDRLKGEGQTSSYQKIYGRAESMIFAGMAVGYGIAALIGGTNYTSLLVFSMAMGAISTLISWYLPTEKKTLPHPEETIRPKYLKEAFKEFRRSKLLQRIIISIAVIAGISGTVEEFEPLYYNLTGTQDTAIAVILMMGVIISAVVSWFAHRIDNSNKYFRLLLIVIGATALFAGSYGSAGLAIFGMFVFMRLIYLSELQYQSTMQHAVSDKVRATVGSLPSFLSQIIVIVVTGLYGLVALLGDDLAAIRTMALLAIFSAIILGVYWRSLKPAARSTN